MSFHAKDAQQHGSSTSVVVHPLLIINITDHVTRLNLPKQRGNARGERTNQAIGCLLGQQTGKKVEIHTSFELDYEVKGDHADIDTAFTSDRIEAFTKTFPDFGVLGWYTTGTTITPNDLAVTHKQICETAGIEDCLVLVMDSNPAAGLKHLPLWTFESHHSTNGDEMEYRLTKIPYSVESEEIERIGIESAMRVDMDTDSNLTLAPQAARLGSAMTMLRLRISVVVAYLKAVKSGEIPPDYEILRQISSVINQLPHSDNPAFRTTYTRDYEDALLMSFLGVITKGTTSLSTLITNNAVCSENKNKSEVKSTMSDMFNY